MTVHASVCFLPPGKKQPNTCAWLLLPSGAVAHVVLCPRQNLTGTVTCRHSFMNFDIRSTEKPASQGGNLRFYAIIVTTSAIIIHEQIKCKENFLNFPTFFAFSGKCTVFPRKCPCFGHVHGKMAHDQRGSPPPLRYYPYSLNRSRGSSGIPVTSNTPRTVPAAPPVPLLLPILRGPGLQLLRCLYYFQYSANRACSSSGSFTPVRDWSFAVFLSPLKPVVRYTAPW